MLTQKFTIHGVMFGLVLFAGVTAAQGAVLVQCPGDKNDDSISRDPDIKCVHLTGGDGYVTMGDGTSRYMFGFADVTGMPTAKQSQKDDILRAALLAHEWPAPTLELEEGTKFYLNLTNVGMAVRPDLFDPHTVHFHGYPQSSTVFDGLPESGISINMGATLTYFYQLNDPGTYMYHCHVEATEHMQMGMLGNLYIKPKQNKFANNTNLNGFTHQTGNTYVYNDGDGSTYYDREYPIQLGSFDSTFHDASENVQPLPFALMRDDYPMINGRGYPDTADSRTKTFPSDPNSRAGEFLKKNGEPWIPTAQPVSSLITANTGEKILLRISNLAITRYYTLQSPGIKMKVVGRDAKLLRAPNGDNQYYETNSVTLGGGESVDVILDTSGLSAGQVYVLHTANLNYLSNDTEAFGGMMTEIHIN